MKRGSAHAQHMVNARNNTGGRSGQCKLCPIPPETATAQVLRLRYMQSIVPMFLRQAPHHLLLTSGRWRQRRTPARVQPATMSSQQLASWLPRGKTEGKFLKGPHPTKEQIDSTDLVDRQVGAIDVGGGVAEQEADDARHGLRRHHASVQRTQRRHARFHHGLARLLPMFCDHLGRQPRRHRLRTGQQQHSVKLATAVGSDNRNRWAVGN